MNFLIPPGVIVDANGSAVVGSVRAQLTYWNPITDVGTGPGDLTTMHTDNSTRANVMQRNVSGPTARELLVTASVYDLQTFGEAQLTLTRNDSRLRIAPGSAATATYYFADAAENTDAGPRETVLEIFHRAEFVPLH